jgi:hypothetical protein
VLNNRTPSNLKYKNLTPKQSHIWPDVLEAWGELNQSIMQLNGFAAMANNKIPFIGGISKLERRQIVNQCKEITLPVQHTVENYAITMNTLNEIQNFNEGDFYMAENIGEYIPTFNTNGEYNNFADMLTNNSYQVIKPLYIIKGVYKEEDLIGYETDSEAVTKLLDIVKGDKKIGLEAVNLIKSYISVVTFGNGQDICRKVGETIFSASLVYDWCYDLISAEESYDNLITDDLDTQGTDELSSTEEDIDINKKNDIEECTSLVVLKENRLFVAQTMFKKSIKISIKSFLISLSLSFLNLFI